MLGDDGVAEKWEATKNIKEPNPDWPLEFMWIGINYYKDQCNSIKLQAIELSGVCACVRVRVCAARVYVLCVVCVGDNVCNIFSFRLPNWKDRESVGMLQTFR
jgi:hypothetical protein